jgi:hypothetical protein
VRSHCSAHARSSFACLILGLTLAACGGAQRRSEIAFPPGPHSPAELVLPDAATRDLALTVSGSTVDELVASVVEALDARGITAFVPALPEGSDALEGFVRYVSFVENVGDVPVQHTVFVVAGPWTTDLERAFVRAFWPMPARVASGGGRPMFHFVGTDGPTATIAYLFGNAWWGALEAAMLGDLATLPEDADGVAALEARLRARFATFGFEPSPGDGGAGLAELLTALPPREGDLRPPAGTLVAAGVLLGGELILSDPAIRWVPVDDGAATFFGLSVDGNADVMLRPIDFMLQAWESGVNDPVHGYLELAREHIAAFRNPSPESGE